MEARLRPPVLERRLIAEAEKVTVKAIIAAILLVVGITVAGCHSAFLRYDLIGTGHLPRSALFPIMLFAVINPVWRFLFKKPLFTSSELLFIYCALVIMSGIPGQQFSNYLYTGLVSPVYHAHPRNMPELLQYEGLNWLQYIPDWAVPSKDPGSGVVAWVFEGMPEGARVPWQPWVLPLTLWTIFFFALFTSHVLIAALLRRQWVEDEKLSFPLAQVPVEAAEEKRLGSMARNLLFWLGFIILVFVFTFRALHIYFPYFPNINIYPNWGAIFQGRPFDVLNYTPFNIYFDMIGVTYLIPSDVGFSFWFFSFVGRRIRMVIRSAMGLTDHIPPLEHQTIGGLFMLFFLQMWVARKYLAYVFQQARQGKGGEEEALPYRHMLILLAICVLIVIAWTVKLGVAIHWAILLFAVHYMWRTVQARMIGESGLFIFWTPYPVHGGPSVLFMRLFGKELIGARNVVGLTMVSSKFGDSAACLVTQSPSRVQNRSFSQLEFASSFLPDAGFGIHCCPNMPPNQHSHHLPDACAKDGLVDERIPSLAGKRISNQVGARLEGSDLSILSHGRWSPFHSLPCLDALAILLVAVPPVRPCSQQRRPLVR